MPDLIDILTRLSTAVRLYLHDSNPKNGVPRSVAHETRNTLTFLLKEAERVLDHEVASQDPRAAASPREKTETDPT